MSDSPVSGHDRGSLAILLCAVAAGIVFVALIYAHFGPVNGPSYFRWPWYREPRQGKVLLLLVLAAAPAFVAQFVNRRRLAVALVIVTPPLLQISAIALVPVQPRGLRRAEAILVDPNTTSYFTAATKAASETGWLRHFDQFTSTVPMHAQTKPPGPTTFFLALIRLLGSERTPMAAAVIMLLFGSAAVGATYIAVRSIADAGAALQAATILCLVPSMTGFYPVIDWLSPVFSVAAIALWHAALDRGSVRIAAVFGLVVFAMSCWNYSLLVLGATCLLMAAAHFACHRRFAVLAQLSAVAACAIALPYVALWLLDGFNPIRNLAVARENQKGLMNMMDAFWIPQGMQRRYPATIAGDLQEFAMAMGWVPIIVAAGWLVRNASKTPLPARTTAIAAFVTPVIVALSGLLPAETARVWIFLMPLVALPAALELARWPAGRRVAVHAVLLACTIAVYSNIFFIIV